MPAKRSKKSVATEVVESEPASVPAPAETIAAYKGFDRELKCRGFAYKVGETYRTEAMVVRCGEGGFHSCEMPLDVFTYYGPTDGRYAEVKAGGQIAHGDSHGDSKFASAEITIKAEIKLTAMIKAAVDWALAHAKTNTAIGYSGHAAATGYRGHAAATGNSGHAAATGYSGHAAATGYRGRAAATGDSGHAAATGDRGHAAATGSRGHAAATGDRGHAAATGKYAIAAALGVDGTAEVGSDGWLVLAAWLWTGDRYELLHVRAAKVGGPEGIKPHVKYRLTMAGEFEEMI